MAIQRACYTTRERVKTAVDLKWSARIDPQIDDAIEAACDTIDGDMHRVFYPQLATRYVDWPNFQSTYPWKIYLDQAELADVTANVPVVTTGGASPAVIPAANIFWGPWNYAPPYKWLELDRSTSSSFGLGSTPQRDVAITGTFGYWVKTTPGGALAAAVTDTTGTTITVTNGALPGVGDNILIDAERMLVTDKAMATTTQTQQGSGCGAASAADNLLAVTDGTKFSAGETLLLDAERMQVTDVAGNTLSVRRAWDGTSLATHSGALVYAARLLTVTRGALGTTAATHSGAAPVALAAVPGLIRQLATAYALVDVSQQTGAYAQSQAEGAAKIVNIGRGVPALAAAAFTAFGRKARSRVV